MAASTTLNREQRIVRARNAAKARTSLDYHVRRVVESAPKLTAQQVDELRALLPPTPASDRGAG